MMKLLEIFLRIRLLRSSLSLFLSVLRPLRIFSSFTKPHSLGEYLRAKINETILFFFSATFQQDRYYEITGCYGVGCLLLFIVVSFRWNFHLYERWIGAIYR